MRFSTALLLLIVPPIGLIKVVTDNRQDRKAKQPEVKEIDSQPSKMARLGTAAAKTWKERKQ